MPHHPAPDTLALTRHALASALRGMALGAAFVLLWVGWHFIGGAPADDRPPHVRVSDVTPGSYKWTDAPLPPPGVPAAEAGRYKLLVLRDADGIAHAFYLSASDGLATVPSVRISAIVDACFRLIVDGESVLPWRRWGSAQELV